MGGVLGPDTGGKPDSVTAGRSSSERCKEEANGNWIIDTVGQTGTTHNHMILSPASQNSQPPFNPTAQNPEEYQEFLPAET